MSDKSTSASELVPGREKLFVYTFGCQMNEYDTLKLKKVLEDRFSEAARVEDADLVLINTCSVRDKPQQKVYSLLGRLKQLKRKKPALIVGVGGCVAQQEGENLVKRSKAVDFVFGTHNLSMVASLVDLRRKGFPPQVAVDYRDEWEDLPLGLPLSGAVSAPIAISRGCNKRCSYCVVPFTRGPEVSRSVDEIVREAKLAVHRGAREVLLLGQTVNSYGRDLSPRSDFVSLLTQISGIEGLFRIRFTSPHPQEVKGDLIDYMAADPKVCRHIHLPLQAGSDEVLKAMNRNYSIQKYLEIAGALKDRMPDMAITTDLIVGFPGETEAQFRQTMKVMEQVPFDNSYSFIFSPRPGTKAAGLPDPVPFTEKLAWLKELQALQEIVAAKILKAFIGKRMEILLDGPSRDGNGGMQGRTSQNVVVNIEESPSCAGLGGLIEADIIDVARFTLRGVRIAPGQA